MQPKPAHSARIQPGHSLFKKNMITGEVAKVEHRTGDRTGKLVQNTAVENLHTKIEAEPNHIYRFALNMKNALKKFPK